MFNQILPSSNCIFSNNYQENYKKNIIFILLPLTLFKLQGIQKLWFVIVFKII